MDRVHKTYRVTSIILFIIMSTFRSELANRIKKIRQLVMRLKMTCDCLLVRIVKLSDTLVKRNISQMKDSAL